jgi:hypothetical protein
MKTDHSPEHDFAKIFGFYRAQLWWIDTFTIEPRYTWYRLHLHGRNDMNGGEDYSWSVPTIVDRPFAFALKQVR